MWKRTRLGPLVLCAPQLTRWLFQPYNPESCATGDRLPVTIDWYGYEVWQGEEKL